MMTVAPSSRNNFAASSPMPEVPPVTRTILFDSFMIFSWFESFWFVAGCSSVLGDVREPDLAEQPGHARDGRRDLVRHRAEPGVGHVFQVEVDNLDVHCTPPVLFWKRVREAEQKVVRMG